MKVLKMTVILVVLLTSGCIEKEHPFEGKVFTIENYIDERLDNTEDLTFNQGTLEGSECVKWGFEKTQYKTTFSENGTPQFSCTMFSAQEGKMVWNGTLNNSELTGTCLWSKEGQKSTRFTFKGSLKSEQ